MTGTPEQLRVVLVTHSDLAESPGRTESALVAGLRARAAVHTVLWEELDLPSVAAASTRSGVAIDDIDVLVLFVRFRLLHAAADFDWHGFSGLRACIEHDAWQGYSSAHPQWRGRYAPAFARHQIGLVLSSGKRTAKLLVQDGIDAVWVPKAYDQERFHDLGRPRDGVCTFGTMWPSRRALLALARRQGHRIDDVSGPLIEMNERLNRYAAGLVCNMPGRPPVGALGRWVSRRRPSVTRVVPAIEPMIKTFETAGAGCALVVDRIEELRDLGFVEGETFLGYSSFEEALELVATTPADEFRRIGRAGHELVASRHTWHHRAAQIVAELRSRVRKDDVR